MGVEGDVYCIDGVRVAEPKGTGARSCVHRTAKRNTRRSPFWGAHTLSHNICIQVDTYHNKIVHSSTICASVGTCKWPIARARVLSLLYVGSNNNNVCETLDVELQILEMRSFVACG